MTIRNLSPATQQSYLYVVSKFSLYFGRSPDRLDVEDIRAYLVHLAAKGFAWSSVNRLCGNVAGWREMAKGHLAPGNQRAVDMSLRCSPYPRCRWSQAPHAR